MDDRALAARTWDDVATLLDSLDEVDLVRPTRCAGWTVLDVAVHLLLDAQRCLIACATPTSAPADVDATTYWSDWAQDADPLSQARGFRFLRITASAYRAPESLLAHWSDVVPAAARALAARDPADRVETQGHVIAVGDLARTLVLEAAVHHLDCLLDQPDAPRPSAAALQVVTETYEGLTGVEIPPTEQWALKGAGRIPLTDRDRVLLGSAARRFPLLG